MLNANNTRRSWGQQNDDIQAEQEDWVSSQWKVTEQGNPTIESGSEWMISIQSGSLPEGGCFDGVRAGGGVIVEKDTNLLVKNHVPIFWGIGYGAWLCYPN